jgi:Spy/CpxP family protein refolding chaperone
MTIKNYFIKAVLLILLMSNSAIYAQKGNIGLQPAGSMADLPSLADEQKEKIKEMRTLHMKEMQSLRNEMNELKARYKTLSESSNPDISAINKNIDAQTDHLNKIMKSNAAHHQAVRKILTDEQKLVFDMRHERINRPGIRRNRVFGPQQGSESIGRNPGVRMREGF